MLCDKLEVSLTKNRPNNRPVWYKWFNFSKNRFLGVNWTANNVNQAVLTGLGWVACRKGYLALPGLGRLVTDPYDLQVKNFWPSSENPD